MVPPAAGRYAAAAVLTEGKWGTGVRQPPSVESVMFRKLGDPWPRVAYSGKHIFVSGLHCPRCGASLHALVPRCAERVVTRGNLEVLLRGSPSCRHQ